MEFLCGSCLSSSYNTGSSSIGSSVDLRAVQNQTSYLTLVKICTLHISLKFNITPCDTSVSHMLSYYEINNIQCVMTIYSSTALRRRKELTLVG